MAAMLESILTADLQLYEKIKVNSAKNPEPYSEPNKTSKSELFAKIVSG